MEIHFARTPRLIPLLLLTASFPVIHLVVCFASDPVVSAHNVSTSVFPPAVDGVQDLESNPVDTTAKTDRGVGIKKALGLIGLSALIAFLFISRHMWSQTKRPREETVPEPEETQEDDSGEQGEVESSEESDGEPEVFEDVPRADVVSLLVRLIKATQDTPDATVRLMRKGAQTGVIGVQVDFTSTCRDASGQLMQRRPGGALEKIYFENPGIVSRLHYSVNALFEGNVSKFHFSFHTIMEEDVRVTGNLEVSAIKAEDDKQESSS